MRFPTTACMTSFAILQTGMVLERALALWKRNEYEHYGNRLGFMISTLCVRYFKNFEDFRQKSDAANIEYAIYHACTAVLSSLLLTAWSLRNMDLTTFTVYCTVSTNETAGSITILCFILCGIDIMSLVGIALLHISNATAMKGQYFSYVAYRTIFAATYTVPYFTLVSPFLICYMIRKSKRTRLAQLSVLRKQQDHERELYFKAYNRMWNNS
ncbi:hypothetical protein GCK32_008346 [Trichostrongylus colubriformis]|uniref:Uncharacterized protein n=1 Tax=Trichostrongylus colubriformis TaxID=6319 RepID=A0AAN8IYR7_TRICO